MTNAVTKTSGSNKIGFTSFMTSTVVQKKVNDILGDEKSGKRFISAIVSAVNNNPQLKECDNASILSGALLGESLNLSPSPQLGNYYLVPFKDKDRGQVATFQLGYKGYIQLAIRSGQYKKLNVLAIKDGELIKYDPLNEEIEVNLIEDEEKREKAKTIGYYAMFEYVNGFRKAMYWSKAKMEAHALQYSKGYQAKKGYTFWEKDFDAMAFKTMLRQLISKWGIMSVDMQQAYENDMAYIKEDGSKEYFDNDNSDFIPEVEVKEEKEIKTLDEIV
jgi:recombination protein RecT